MSNEPRSYVRRKKTKRFAWIIFGIGFVGCSMLAIIAFINKLSGQFTIKMDDNSINLRLSSQDDFADSSTYLRGSALTQATTINADFIDGATQDGGSEDTLSGEHSYVNRPNAEKPEDYTTYFSAYTFYVQNLSEEAVNYSVSVLIDDYQNPSNQTASLLDIMRVRVYENSTVEGQALSEKSHASTCYGRASTSPYYDSDGNWINTDPIAQWTKDANSHVVPDDSSIQRDENKGYCTNFVNDSKVCERVYEGLQSKAIVRYTVVLWLSGEDPNAIGAQPEDASVTLSMHFSALSYAPISSSSSSGN